MSDNIKNESNDSTCSLVGKGGAILLFLVGLLIFSVVVVNKLFLPNVPWSVSQSGHFFVASYLWFFGFRKVRKGARLSHINLKESAKLDCLGHVYLMASFVFFFTTFFVAEALQIRAVYPFENGVEIANNDGWVRSYYTKEFNREEQKEYMVPVEYGPKSPCGINEMKVPFRYQPYKELYVIEIWPSTPPPNFRPTFKVVNRRILKKSFKVIARRWGGLEEGLGSYNNIPHVDLCYGTMDAIKERFGWDAHKYLVAR